MSLISAFLTVLLTAAGSGTSTFTKCKSLALTTPASNLSCEGVGVSATGQELTFSWRDSLKVHVNRGSVQVGESTSAALLVEMNGVVPTGFSVQYQESNMQEALRVPGHLVVDVRTAFSLHVLNPAGLPEAIMTFSPETQTFAVEDVLQQPR